MNRMMVTVGGIAAVALLAVGGVYFVSRGNGIGAPTASPTASPKGSSTVAPSPTSASTLLRSSSASLAPGSYYIDIDGYRYTFKVAGQGWTSFVGTPDVILTKSDDKSPDFANVWLWGRARSDQLVWGTACNWTGTSTNPGPSVDELATAISSLPDFQTTSPTAVTVAGHTGLDVQVTVPGDATLATCDQSEYRSWDGRYYQRPGQTDDVRVLDLGGDRTLVFTSRFSSTSAATLAEQAALFDSLVIAPAPGAAATAIP